MYWGTSCSVDATSVRLKDGTLAGSILSLDQALRNLIEFTGCTAGGGAADCHHHTGEGSGLKGERGRIEQGTIADMVLLTPDLRVYSTIVEGQVVSAPVDVTHHNGNKSQQPARKKSPCLV